MANSITQVDQEISLLEQVKASAETCLQEKALYTQVLEECVTLRDGRLAGDLVYDHVEEQLAREVQLCEDVKQLVQQRITEVLEHQRTLKEMRSQLLADQKDKGDAINLNSQCLTLNLQSPSIGYRYQISNVTKGILTYEQWIAHCQNLKKSAEKVVLDSSYFRNNLQYSLSQLIHSLEAQRIATEFSFRKRLDELSRAKDALEWEKQQVMEAVNELQAEMQKVESQILSSGSEEQLAQTQLDILAQRLNYELCLDQGVKSNGR
ncbi:tektin-2-like [Colossoma macropomum]|uniref:tektin-2-like n=1 Tax=Colossoma macropomum TaxID=42526 RepID=UPI001864A472|nr:tektin-2-like [Colossoma macropomum]